MPRRDELLLTCEHGGNRVPPEWCDLFLGAEDILATHRGYDPGALDLGRHLARRFRAPFFFSTTTRLLVELNRSLHHRRLFSEFSDRCDKVAKRRIIGKYWSPYRTAVESHVLERIGSGARVIHVSVHSFTPVLDGETRRAEIGILYDPERASERAFASMWRDAFQEERPGWRVRRNYPYAGRADGFTTALRREFPDEAYLGIELEVNQKFAGKETMNPEVKGAVAASLERALSGFTGKNGLKI